MEERERERTGRCELLYHFPCTFRILPMQLRTDLTKVRRTRTPGTAAVQLSSKPG